MGIECGMDKELQKNKAMVGFGGFEEGPSAAFVFADKLIALDMLENGNNTKTIDQSNFSF
jgi:hypothetical protein